MFKVYILKSINTGRYYVGQACNLSIRIKEHNSGKSKSTSPYKPWEIIYSEDCLTRGAAHKREMEIKKYKGGIKFKKLLGLWQEV